MTDLDKLGERDLLGEFQILYHSEDLKRPPRIVAQKVASFFLLGSLPNGFSQNTTPSMKKVPKDLGGIHRSGYKPNQGSRGLTYAQV